MEELEDLENSFEHTLIVKQFATSKLFRPAFNDHLSGRGRGRREDGEGEGVGRGEGGREGKGGGQGEGDRGEKAGGRERERGSLIFLGVYKNSL